ncbi:MAG TPA: hypothetical protein VGS22_26090 [Thermoanaerobaculia bacterium]|jgi:hypothetical protein|nr:hypothetical protein [Thermoanaerobaculia bacterium]
MTRNIRLFSQLAMIGFLIAGTAYAATANFQGECSNSTVGGQLHTDCTFSPNKAPAGQPFTGCNGAGVSSYGWTFGDGTGSVTTPTSDFGRAYHTYVGTVGLYIGLTVYCSNGAAPQAYQCLCNAYTCSGCIAPGGGWMPY